MGREFGIVKTFDSFKGFGFIRRNKGKDVFFFYDQINNDDKIIEAGCYVSFDLKLEAKGPRAYNIDKESG